MIKEAVTVVFLVLNGQATPEARQLKPAQDTTKIDNTVLQPLSFEPCIWPNRCN